MLERLYQQADRRPHVFFDVISSCSISRLYHHYYDLHTTNESSDGGELEKSGTKTTTGTNDTNAVSISGWLHTSGNLKLDSDGNPFLGRGVSIGDTQKAAPVVAVIPQQPGQSQPSRIEYTG